MNSNWTQILVFTILALILGFILGRVTGHHPKEHRMEKRIIKKELHSGDEMHWDDEAGGSIHMSQDEDQLTVTVMNLEDSGFEGDTIIDGALINIMRNGDEVQVKVEMESDEPKQIRKRVELESD